ncbi:alpha mannosidase-like protein [Modicella reniformis]|uniref:alpha-1,2-Mannosidase n=1 Tax=Modicella reniformis TaxID=1440133 RepID=A0A9P6MLI9_9FUNG|nr:alpha mannosidase-like protein [Modicella reniformis]
MSEFFEATGLGSVVHDFREADVEVDESDSKVQSSSAQTTHPSTRCIEADSRMTKQLLLHSEGSFPRGTTQLGARLANRREEVEYRQKSVHSATHPVNLQNGENSNNSNAATVNNGGIHPWIILFIFSIVQLFISSTIPSNGVNASSSDQVADPGADNGGGGNNAHGVSGKSYNRQYFRQLPPITNPSRAAGAIVTEQMTESRRSMLRKEAKDMFLHGYHGYLNYAFPKDELNPVACTGRGPDRQNPNNININDVLGDFSLTLIDALDTLAVMREPELFRQAIQLVKRHVSDFDINSRVQVFEVNIRVLGALLSGHLYASDPALKSVVKGYNGELLSMAEDLGKRLMKAFKDTPTGIPWPRVNLRKGVLRDESSETCAAGAGSLLLEFGVLSRLTGNRSYEEAARRALLELWNRRSKIGLMGNTINITTGQWMSAMTGIGAGTDSFYEYLLKSYVLFGDDEHLDMYETSQEAIRRNLLHDSKYFYKHVHLQDGSLLAQWVDSLSAFMPGVQVLGGDLESAIKNHLYYYNIWRRFQAIPERFDFVQQTVTIPNYPLRPEFIESNYFLYRATKDPFYLQVGEMVLRDLQTYAKTKCGWASLRSVIDKKHEDRMESFALSETMKYLYLLFDEENLLHQELKDSNFVFTTEGHVLTLSSKYLYNRTRGPGYQGPRQQYSTRSLTDAIHNTHYRDSARAGPICKPYRAPETFLKSIPYRPDADFARQMVGAREDFRDLLHADPKGFCEKPTLEVERVLIEFSGPPKKTFFEDDEDESTTSEGRQENDGEPKKLMVIPIKMGVFVNKIVGVKMHIQYDESLNGYRAVKVADHPLSLNCNVYVEQKSMQPLWDTYQRAQEAHLRVFGTNPSPSVSGVVEKDLLITPAAFGYWRPRILHYNHNPSTNIHVTSLEDHLDQAISQQPLMRPASVGTSAKRITTKGLIRVQENKMACRPYTTEQAAKVRDTMVVVDRGGCLFILKAYYAQAAGAHGIVVINTEDATFSMTGASSSEAAPGNEESTPRGGNSGIVIGEGIQDDDIDIHAVMISRSDGHFLLNWIREEEDLALSSSSSSPSEVHKRKDTRLVAGIVQRKVSKEEMANARLSYNSLPIVNVFSIAAPLTTFG